MAEVLELPELLQRHREPEMDIRGGRVDTEFDVQGPAKTQFAEQFRFADDLSGSAFEELKLLFRGFHGQSKMGFKNEQTIGLMEKGLFRP
jgi:hypothetical protein